MRTKVAVPQKVCLELTKNLGRLVSMHALNTGSFETIPVVLRKKQETFDQLAFFLDNAGYDYLTFLVDLLINEANYIAYSRELMNLEAVRRKGNDQRFFTRDTKKEITRENILKEMERLVKKVTDRV
jgi:hypothetical protein